ncbi:MAG TPA: long-chain-fatty-acid--CoA ligase [Xanthobacteraceae bacterium]
MNSYLTQGLKRAAQINRNGTATICEARRRTWSEVRERVARLAGGLRQLGLSAGGRVAIMSLNGDRYLELHFAVLWAGGTLLPINMRLAPPEIAYILADGEPELICADDAGVALLANLAPPLTQPRVHLGDASAPEGWHSYERMIEATPAADDAERCGHDLAGIFYTGGSTGKAKGVMLSHDNLMANAMNAILLVGFDRTSVYLHAPPMFHLNDGMSTYAVTMVGGTHVFIPRFEPGACLAAIQQYRVTNVALAPTMVTMLINHPGVETFDFSAMRQIHFGSSPMPEATLKRAIELWPNLLLNHGWGMTETSPIGTMLPWELRLPAVAGERLRSCGHSAPNCEVMVVDEAGKEVARGAVGELIIRGPNVMVGYWKKPEETAAALRNGWLYTGDAAVMDEDGFVYIVDRLKDMIISGGENVYSTEVESAISLFPGVAEVAVIGIPDERWGEAVHAIIVPRPGAGLDVEKIRQHCRGLIAGYKVPRSIEIRASPLPLSGSGKVLKTVLREPFWRGRRL